MAKKVLIAEPSLAVRGIAESLLRQNGYEVVAADTVAAAREIVGGSKVDLLLVASDLKDKEGNRFFEALGAEKSTAMLPVIVLHDASTGEEITYPQEAIINKPFAPKEFLESIASFAGGGTATAKPAPIDSDDLEDALIDSALGLDKIEVDDAEVLEDDSSVFRKRDKKGKVESMIGFDYKVSPDDTTKKSVKKIDAVNLPPESDKIGEKQVPEKELTKPETQDAGEIPDKHQESPIQKPPDVLSESSKIEIVTDQYGISMPEQMTISEESEADDGAHDFDWFMKELRKEAEEETSPSGKDDKPPSPPSPPAKKDQTGQPQAQDRSQLPEEKPSPPEQISTHTEAVDKFISEFKKEMEKITGDSAANIEVANIEVANIAPEETDRSQPPPKGELSWEEGLEKISPTGIRKISKELIDVIGDKIAEKIVGNLDQDIIYHLIKDSIDNILQRRTEIKEKQT